ncbi:hypothetical protein HPB47_007714 [Ixodes persulcatus]|uniref:Uncharacterized protein n=1 Tax=Ixodes persulcatus TaxID=34615 RepID=A0AC60P7K1_IXOPE|nr:hypothetical protein HPB47_007714 [Ixodes persulcatus]
MYHCEFNTTQLVWRKVKSYVAIKNKLFTLQEVKWLLPEALVSVTQEDWQNCCAHVERVEVLDNTREDDHVCLGDTTCCKTPSGKCNCCPSASGVCCSDLTHCCPQGFTCDLSTQSCRRDPLHPFVRDMTEERGTLRSCPRFLWVQALYRQVEPGTRQRGAMAPRLLIGRLNYFQLRLLLRLFPSSTRSLTPRPPLLRTQLAFTRRLTPSLLLGLIQMPSAQTPISSLRHWWSRLSRQPSSRRLLLDVFSHQERGGLQTATAITFKNFRKLMFRHTELLN